MNHFAAVRTSEIVLRTAKAIANCVEITLNQ